MNEQGLIFIADDDADMRGLLAESLRDQGFQVREACDGLELLQLLEKARASEAGPSLVISDLHMAGASGFDVLHWLQRWLPDVPAILISAYADVWTTRRAFALGASAVIQKPFDLTEIEEQAHFLARR